ncbi:MAG: hypothetical protein KJZ80_18770 [Hyphomicrobiaceae bacterium]|nr:hypothetical protein [Hyphomicrobiaceae bacterium]
MAQLCKGRLEAPAGGHRLKRLTAALMLAGWTSLPFAVGSANAQTDAGKPVINVASVIFAEPAVETPFPIQIGPAAAIPQQTFLRIRGLPSKATLSEGHAIAAGAWAIPLSSLPRLKIAAPVGAPGTNDVMISLVAIDGRILSEVKAKLVIAPASAIAPPAQGAAGQPGANTAALGPPGAAPALGPARLPLQPPTPPPPQISAEDRDRALKYMERGDQGLGNGNITIARLFYERAAELDWGPAALALAATYDPNELSRLTIVGGVEPDLEEARKWYERARELGAVEANERLQRLGAR